MAIHSRKVHTRREPLGRAFSPLMGLEPLRFHDSGDEVQVPMSLTQHWKASVTKHFSMILSSLALNHVRMQLSFPHFNTLHLTLFETEHS